MDTLSQKVRKVAEGYIRNAYHGEMFPAFDDEHQSYAVFARGELNGKRYYNVALHLRVVHGNVFVEAHNTDADLASDLQDAGIPLDIVKFPESVSV